MSTRAPLVNMTNSHGAQIPEKSETALKPYMATNTTMTPTASTTNTNHGLVGYQFSCAGMPNKNLTAVDDTVIIAAEITVKMTTFAQLYSVVMLSPAIL